MPLPLLGRRVNRAALLALGLEAMATASIPMTFADREGQLVHIDEVSNGLACGCSCPGCGERMVAKQGPKTVHHFAHEGGSDCAGGLQTALHRAAKAILSQEKRMRLPELKVLEEAKDGAGRTHEASRTLAPKTIAFDKVIDETRFGSVVPDIMGKIGDRTLLVEVAVHHFVDEAKLAKLREAGVACVEIDLSGMLDGWGWASLRSALVDGAVGKAWIFNPRESALRAAARMEAEAKAVGEDRRAARVAVEIQRAHEIQRSEIAGFREAAAKLDALVQSGQLERDRARLAAAGPQLGVWVSASRALDIQWGSAPEHLNIQVPGESGILADRRVWQAGLFALFIKGNQAKSFSTKAAAKWCVATFPRRSEFAVLQKHERLLTRDQAAALPWAFRAVSGYLSELARRGFLKSVGARHEIIRPGPH